MKVAITGGTGYVGPAVVEETLAAGHEVVALEHRRRLEVPDHPRLRRVKGSVDDEASLRAAFAECDAVIHLVAILRERKGATFQAVHVEGTRRVVAAAKAAGVRRFVLMSANGVDLGVETPYFRTKREMERLVKEAGFDWTILRPSYIAGAREGGFDAQFARIVDLAPILPAFDGGRFEIQPVSRRNIAQAFVRALTTPAAIGRTYVLAGPERFTWREYLRRLARVRRRRRWIMPVPRWLILPISRLRVLPADHDTLVMLMAGNVGDPEPARKDLGLELERWEDAVAGLRR